MSGEFDDTVKQGYVRLRSRHLGVWQRRWIIFKKASSAGPKRLEKFVDEKAAIGGNPHKIILLDTATFVTRLPRENKRHGLVVKFSEGATRQFCCESEMEADDWCKALALELCPEHCGIATGEPDILMAGLHMEQSERFHVNLLPCSQLSMSGECTLQVTEENIYLWDIFNPRLKLVTWPLHALRRYGRDSTRFTFESGRFCETGEGLFTVKTTQGEDIYQRVHTASLAIAETLERARTSQKRYSPEIEMKIFGPMLSALSSSNSSPRSLSSSRQSISRSSSQHSLRRMTPKHTMLQKAASFHLPLDSPSKKPYAVLTSSPGSSSLAHKVDRRISPSHSHTEFDSGVDVGTESNTPTSDTARDELEEAGRSPGPINRLRDELEEGRSPGPINRLRIAKGTLSVCGVGTCSCSAHTNEEIWVRRPPTQSPHHCKQPSVPQLVSTMRALDHTATALASDPGERCGCHDDFLTDGFPGNRWTRRDGAITSSTFIAGHLQS